MSTSQSIIFGGTTRGTLVVKDPAELHLPFVPVAERMFNGHLAFYNVTHHQGFVNHFYCTSTRIEDLKILAELRPTEYVPPYASKKVTLEKVILRNSP